MLDRPAKLQQAVLDEALAATVVSCIGSPLDIITACPAAFGLAFQLTRMMSLPLQIFFHNGFGERALTSGNVFFVLVIMYALAGYAGPREMIFAMPAVNGFVIAYLVASLMRLFGIYKRIRENTPVHSYYNGRPWPFFFRICRNEDVIKRYLEPITAALLGIIIAQFSPVGAFIGLSAVFLAVHSHLQYMLRRRKYLDTRDAQIEAQLMQERLQERPTVGTGGVAVVISNGVQMMSRLANLGKGKRQTSGVAPKGHSVARRVVRNGEPAGPRIADPPCVPMSGREALAEEPHPSGADFRPADPPTAMAVVDPDDPELDLTAEHRAFAREQLQQGNLVASCPATGCGNVMAFEAKSVGRKARCHKCGTVCRVPKPEKPMANESASP
ncbi:MAG: hypothetical protein KJ057_16725 [Phycisphaerae bacterium]|nr:MAG: hypothetical protein EDS66_14070 [Planctomycetota bacterium]MBE7457349.1 hypothetical protein [Planctomycetia bacterium]MCL4720112.1 hypothetical protein [Phycisphaerae bacterium]